MSLAAFKPPSTRTSLRRRRSIVRHPRLANPSPNNQATPLAGSSHQQDEPRQESAPRPHSRDHDPSSHEDHASITPSKHTPRPIAFLKSSVSQVGPLRPFRLLRQDLSNLRSRWASDWAPFNQLIVASAVYVFFTNLLPGITFASDLYVLTGQNWGTIEVVFSTGLCGVIFGL
ncbi:MAG: hypothetical protein MMC23_005648 [Stictis urceolatum]|nr:hypothetical protein [Stictis urceolata]